MSIFMYILHMTPVQHRYVYAHTLLLMRPYAYTCLITWQRDYPSASVTRAEDSPFMHMELLV